MSKIKYFTEKTVTIRNSQLITCQWIKFCLDVFFILSWMSLSEPTFSPHHFPWCQEWLNDWSNYRSQIKLNQVKLIHVWDQQPTLNNRSGCWNSIYASCPFNLQPLKQDCWCFQVDASVFQSMLVMISLVSLMFPCWKNWHWPAYVVFWCWSMPFFPVGMLFSLAS